MRIQDLDLDAIKARVDAATAGPWRLETDSCDCGGEYGCSHGSFPHALQLPAHTVAWADKPCDPGDSLDDYRHKASEISDLTMADAELLAHAREDIPALLAEIERLRARQVTPAMIDAFALACPSKGIRWREDITAGLAAALAADQATPDNRP